VVAATLVHASGSALQLVVVPRRGRAVGGGRAVVCGAAKPTAGSDPPRPGRAWSRQPHLVWALLPRRPTCKVCCVSPGSRHRGRAVCGATGKGAQSPRSNGVLTNFWPRFFSPLVPCTFNHTASHPIAQMWRSRVMDCVLFSIAFIVNIQVVHSMWIVDMVPGLVRHWRVSYN
jgi:hypothetical protein